MAVVLLRARRRNQKLEFHSDRLLEAALHALADHVADPAVEDATRLQGLFSSFCDQLRADEPDPEELYADLRGIVEVLPRLEDRTLEALGRMDRVLKMVARLD